MNAKTRMLLSAVATLVGTVVGAGFLGIPKALTMSGFLPGLLMMMAVAVVMIIMSLFATELSLNTKKVHQMPGMVSKYLGKKIGVIASIVFALISVGAMMAYLIGCSDIISHYTGINQLYCMIAYFLILSFFVFKGLRLIEKAELYLGIGMIIFLLILVASLSGNFNINKLLIFEITNLIIPFGVIIFSFGGYNVMTEVEEITNGSKDLMIKTSFIGTLIPFVFFLSFAVIMLGSFGGSVADIATESLTGWVGVIGNTIAFLAMTSSYIISGLLMRDMFIDDHGMKPTMSSLITMITPLLIVLLASPTFIDTLAFTGAVLAGLFAVILSATVIVHRRKIRKAYFTTPGGIITPILTSLFFLAGVIIILT
ncbi:MAG: hypothetical protein JW791_01420 [Nanoarchaeota archaeon]|nr:hypothetical protein [Nanoarchaeota archaeon]